MSGMIGFVAGFYSLIRAWRVRAWTRRQEKAEREYRAVTITYRATDLGRALMERS